MATEDFESTCASHNSSSELSEEVSFDTHEDSSNGFFGKDVLVIARETITEEEESQLEDNEPEFGSSMASKKSAKKPAVVARAKAAPAITNPKPTKRKTLPSPASIVSEQKPTVETAAVPVKQNQTQEQEDHHVDVTRPVYKGAKVDFVFGKNIGLHSSG